MMLKLSFVGLYRFEEGFDLSDSHMSRYRIGRSVPETMLCSVLISFLLGFP